MTELEVRIRILRHIQASARQRMKIASTVVLVGLMSAIVVAIVAATSGVGWWWLVYALVLLFVVRSWVNFRSYSELDDAVTADIHHLRAER